jgi:uncharacterized protein YndB with AHSA1/START domain
MGIKTSGSIEVDAPPETVFQWITVRGKIAQWAGADPNYMPQDASELKAGYRGEGSMIAPDGPRKVEFEVTGCEPPTKFEYKASYPGGEGSFAYTLSPSGKGTLVETASDVDYAQMAALPEQAEEQLQKASRLQRMFFHHQLHEMQEQYASGAMDDNPQVKGAMQAALQQQLSQMKMLAEADAAARG